jgi:hypothetical protein
VGGSRRDGTVSAPGADGHPRRHASDHALTLTRRVLREHDRGELGVDDRLLDVGVGLADRLGLLQEQHR